MHFEECNVQFAVYIAQWTMHIYSMYTVKCIVCSGQYAFTSECAVCSKRCTVLYIWRKDFANYKDEALEIYPTIVYASTAVFWRHMVISVVWESNVSYLT